jgi:glycosyltransferase involved in cell wall biosynthesis
MRIALNAHLVDFTKTYRQAGVSRYTEMLINGLAIIDHQNQYLVYAAPKQNFPANFANAANFKIKQSILPTRRPPVRIGWEQAIAPVVTLRDKVDLLHCPVNVVPLLAPCKTIVTIHDIGFILFPETYKTAKRLYLTNATRLTAKRAAHILTDAEANRQEIIQHLRVPEAKVTTVPLGYDEDTFFPITDAAKLQAFREAHNLPERFILYVGTLQPRKNIPLLLKGFAKLRREQPNLAKDVHLIIAGAKGWLYEDIFRLTKALELDGVAQFPGFVNQEDLPLWYNCAECFAYPSKYEGFGLPPLEAMACGTPVITSTVSSLPEVVGDAAIKVNPDDVAMMADALAQVLGSSSTRAEMRQKGLAQSARFTWQETARKTLAVYNKIMNV